MQADCLGNELPMMGTDWPALVPYSPEVAAWCKSSLDSVGYWLPLVGISGSCDLGFGCLGCLVQSFLELVLNCPEIWYLIPQGLTDWTVLVWMC